jgi:hypothetical protein
MGMLRQLALHARWSRLSKCNERLTASILSTSMSSDSTNRHTAYQTDPNDILWF